MQNNRRYGSYYKYGIISFMLDKSQSVIKQQPFFSQFYVLYSLSRLYNFLCQEYIASFITIKFKRKLFNKIFPTCKGRGSCVCSFAAPSFGWVRLSECSDLSTCFPVFRLDRNGLPGQKVLDSSLYLYSLTLHSD